MKELELPEVPLISGLPDWGVVNTVYAPVMDYSSRESKIITHLRRGAVVNIINRTPYQVKIGNANSYWYRIHSESVDGWVYGEYLLLYETQEKAANAAKEIQK
jgi:hypothetical protein